MDRQMKPEFNLNPESGEFGEVIYVTKAEYEALKIYYCKHCTSCRSRYTEHSKCVECGQEKTIHVGFWSPDGTNRELKIK